MKNHQIPFFYRLTVALSIFGLMLSTGSFAFPKLHAGLLCFYYGALWLLWTGCFFLSLEKKIMKLFCLWIIIDISILIMFFSVTASVGDVSRSKGTEIVWGIAYLPVSIVVWYLLGLLL
jgi:hypothetical protein